MFKRRTSKTWLLWFWHFLWPNGGWSRRFEYVKYRIKRLPDSPKRISLGIAAGVFASFTPLYGFHFFVAMILAKLIRGNMLAALTGTFFGNPLTYVPIGVISLNFGCFILGIDQLAPDKIIEIFIGAWSDFGQNLVAITLHQPTKWHKLGLFINEVFLPYSIGCIIPGLVTALICYYISFPLIFAFKNRSKGILIKKLTKYRKKGS